MKITRDQVVNYVKISLLNSEEISNGYTFKQIQEFCQNEEIKVDKDMIEKFIDEAVKASSIEMCEADKQYNSGNLTTKNSDGLINRSLKNCNKQLTCEFNTTYLNFLKDSFKIYKTKCLKLCELVEMLQGTISEDVELLKSLDVSYSADYVSREDVDRIVKPLIYNFVKAHETYCKANNLNIYLATIVRENDIFIKGTSYWDLLPGKELQNKRIASFKNIGYIELTEKQKQQLKTESNVNF